jgi:hypothetical protein
MRGARVADGLFVHTVGGCLSFIYLFFYFWRCLYVFLFLPLFYFVPMFLSVFFMLLSLFLLNTDVKSYLGGVAG